MLAFSIDWPTEHRLLSPFRLNTVSALRLETDTRVTRSKHVHLQLRLFKTKLHFQWKENHNHDKMYTLTSTIEHNDEENTRI